jgi:hypothetical protein
MYAERQTVSITTESTTGNGTSYSTNVTGRLLTVQYAKGNFTNGVDITITGEASGLSLLTLTDQNSSAVFHPRAQVHAGNGTALSYNGNASLPVTDAFMLANERIKIAVTQAGNSTIGNFTLTVG